MNRFKFLWRPGLDSSNNAPKETQDGVNIYDGGART